VTEKPLKTGFSTGTAAAAAAGAALETLLTGRSPDRIDVALPEGGGWLTVDVAAVEKTADGAVRAGVVKDGGDDPDATHRAVIQATVYRLAQDAAEEIVSIEGGPGVGQVTRPGLPVAVGRPAINPVPMDMIADAARRAWADAGQTEPVRVRIVVSVPNGEAIAQKTLNPRLGIVGGISILGTTGLVKPFSHEAYTATIDSGLSVARALGLGEVVLTTGGKSEKMAMNLRPDLPDTAFIQIADHFGFALDEVRSRGFRRMGIVCFFGKAVKQARDLDCTHAHQAGMDLVELAGWLEAAGADAQLVRRTAAANTARQVLDLLRDAGRLDLAAEIGRRLTGVCRNRLGPRPDLWVRILDFGGEMLYEADAAGGGRE
jgi:cobalt-precorrin-5B (C1)-methyltransferase